jgi:catechol 2,3-dioxygenase-like lactoylglutathione lyase family enzyme
MPNFLQVTPFLFVDDIDRIVDFFTHSLGFKLYVRYDEFAYVQRGSAGVRILGGGAKAGRDPIYFDVEEVDALWTELRATLDDNALRNHLEGPRDQTYGQREFTVFGPENVGIFFGQEIFRDEPAWERAQREAGGAA